MRERQENQCCQCGLMMMMMHNSFDYIENKSLLSQIKQMQESKVLQYFGNERHNSAALDAFVKVMKMANQTG